MRSVRCVRAQATQFGQAVLGDDDLHIVLGVVLVRATGTSWSSLET